MLRCEISPCKVLIVLCVVGIDKITEKSQVSQDGTMVTLPHSDSPHTSTKSGIAAGASDSESNSERDHEVSRWLVSLTHTQKFSCFFLQLKCFFGFFWCKVNRTQSESASSRLSSVSSTAAWSANSDWVRTNPSSAHIYLLPSVPWVYFLSCDVLHHLPGVRSPHGRPNFPYRRS